MAETIITKKCPDCKQIKQLSEFHKSRAKKDGYQIICKVCRKEENLKYRKTHPEKCKASQKVWRSKNKNYPKQWRATESGKLSEKKTQRRYNQSAHGKLVRHLHHQTEPYKILKRRGQKAYILRNPKRGKAIRAVQYAIASNKLPRPDTLLCYYCPKPAQQYHHWHGYEKEHWLDIVPACIICHSKITLKT